MKILIADAFGRDLPDKLKEFGEVTEDKNELGDADVVLVRSATKADAAYLAKAKNLKLIIRGGVGVDNIDLNYCHDHNIIVRNTPEASSVAVAELAMTLMLGIMRNIVKAHNTTKAGQWAKKELKGRELYRKTLGLVGIGRIGYEVAKRALAFDMEVLFNNRSGSKEAEKIGAVHTALDDLLARSDIVSLHVPLTDQTKGMVNSEFIDRMKNGAVLINTARGKLLNEQDVFDALQSGRLGFLGTDVYMTEPPGDSPLLRADNVLLAPHIGASTYENMDRIGEMVCHLIRDLAEGRKIESL